MQFKSKIIIIIILTILLLIIINDISYSNNNSNDNNNNQNTIFPKHIYVFNIIIIVVVVEMDQFTADELMQQINDLKLNNKPSVHYSSGNLSAPHSLYDNNDYNNNYNENTITKNNFWGDGDNNNTLIAIEQKMIDDKMRKDMEQAERLLGIYYYYYYYYDNNFYYYKYYNICYLNSYYCCCYCHEIDELGRQAVVEKEEEILKLKSLNTLFKKKIEFDNNNIYDDDDDDDEEKQKEILLFKGENIENNKKDTVSIEVYTIIIIHLIIIIVSFKIENSYCYYI